MKPMRAQILFLSFAIALIGAAGVFAEPAAQGEGAAQSAVAASGGAVEGTASAPAESAPTEPASSNQQVAVSSGCGCSAKK